MLMLSLLLMATTLDEQLGACVDRDDRQGALTACANAAYNRADHGLNVQWAKTAEAFKRHDKVSSGSSEEPAFPLLLKAQRAWLAYRNATCRSVSLDNGSISPMNFALCMERITKLRTAELLELSHNPNNPDEPF